MNVAIVIVLALGSLVAVLRPLLRPAAAASPERRQARELVEERDRALGALKELELEHRTGIVSDADYAEQLPQLRSAALAALERMRASRRAA